MLCQLPSSHDNGQSIVMYSTGSVNFHRLMTTDRAWLFTPKICNMLCQLSSSHDNGQSMVIYPSCMKQLRQLSWSNNIGLSMANNT